MSNEPRSVETKGKTVDAAIFAGLDQMGLSIDQVDVEILHEGSKGIFGLGKSAQVRLTEKVSRNKAGAEEFLNELFEKMGVSAKAYAEETEEAVRVQIEGDSTGVLIGRRGETLDALQYLTSLVVNKGAGEYRRVSLDTENYRQKREETLVRLANRVAAKVVKTGRKVVMEPMNPYERRILHSALQSNPKVETVSEGEEPYRRVIVKRKK